MNKLSLFFILGITAWLPATAQNKGIIVKGSLSVGKQDNSGFDTTAYADASTWVEIGKDTTNKGIILPRVDINTFSTPKRGVFVYDLNDSVLYHVDGTDKVRYTRQRDLAAALGQYFVQGGNTFGQPAILGTTDMQHLLLKTHDTSRIRIDSLGRIKMGDVGVYRKTIDPPNNNYDTLDKGNKWAFEHMKVKGYSQFVFNNTDSMGGVFFFMDNDCEEGGTGPRLITYGRGSTGKMWGGQVPYGRGSGNVNGGLAQLGVNGSVDLVIGATSNNHSNIFFGSGNGVALTIAARQGLRKWSQKVGGICVNCPYGTGPHADFQVNGNILDSGKLILAEAPNLPDSGAYTLVGRMPNTGLIGNSAIKANSNGFFVKGNIVDTGSVSITNTPVYSAGGYTLMVHNNTTNRLETVDTAAFKNYNNLLNKPIYSYTPTSSSDPNGQTGDVTYDNTYMYIKTAAGWRRTLLQTF